MPEIQFDWLEGWLVWGEVQQLKLRYTQPLYINKFIIAVPATAASRLTDTYWSKVTAEDGLT